MKDSQSVHLRRIDRLPHVAIFCEVDTDELGEQISWVRFFSIALLAACTYTYVSTFDCKHCDQAGGIDCVKAKPASRGLFFACRCFRE
jgi:hypothetical protein